MNYAGDNILIEDLVMGKEEAFEHLIESYGQKLLKTCYLILKSEANAEDVVQEVFLEIYKSIRKFKRNSSLYTWIYRIAINKCRDRLKRTKDYVSFDEEVVLEAEDNTEYDALGKIEKGIIKDIVLSVPDIYREVIVLHYFQEMPLNKISEVLGESLNTVKSKLHRGRNKIKEILIKEGIGHE